MAAALQKKYNATSLFMHEDQRAVGGVSVDRDELATVAALHARDLIVLLDPSGIILWASPSHLDVLGHDPATMIGRRNIEFLHPADLDRVVEALRERLTDRTAKTMEFRVMRSDGSSLEVESVGVPILAADGSVARVAVSARDITERKRLERRLRVVLDQLPANVWTTDRDLNVTSSAGGGLSTLGVSQQQEVGAPLARYFQDDERLATAIDMHQRVLRGEHLVVETRWRDRDLHLRMHPLRNEVGEIDGTIGITFDVTELRRAERRYRQLFERNVAGVFRSTVTGRLVECNESFARIFGYETPSEMLAMRTPALYFNSADRDELIALIRARGEAVNFEVRMRRKDGHPLWLLLNEFITMSDDVGEETLEGTIIDITARKLAEERVEYQAYHDALTDLPNRFLFNDRLLLSLSRARRHGRGVGVLFLDLDHFKLINDTMAHSAGDELLRSVAARLLTCLRADDTVARIGGDEFVFILPEIDHPTAAAGAAKVAEKVLDAVRHPFVVQGRELFVTASVGIAISPHDGDDIETLVKNADGAMYRAKEAGRNNYQFHTPLAQHRAELRLTLESALRRAIGRDELFLVYQPIVELASNRITGFEALLRWHRPGEGVLEPKDFIPLAEDIGAIVPIGEWVFWTACRQLRAWQSAGARDLRIAVNLSPRQFHDERLTRMVEEVLSETSVDAQSLDLELTESLSIRDSDLTIGRLSHFRSMGVGVLLDDFGTGYSSLAQLRFLPITGLKIDRSFISDLHETGPEKTIVNAIVTMGHALGLRVVAEGVEHPGQRVILRELACDEMQGFVFSPPVPADEAERLLKA
jgi:diguanylate cyclase (GGDEF)-like protein/PAS domain S-box-containing protein